MTCEVQNRDSSYLPGRPVTERTDSALGQSDSRTPQPLFKVHPGCPGDDQWNPNNPLECPTSWRSTTGNVPANRQSRPKSRSVNTSGRAQDNRMGPRSARREPLPSTRMQIQDRGRSRRSNPDRWWMEQR
ncbi:uncharacterized protein LOC120417070 [Culex pipiens pallens]|uniref:uncharacterized protein LOC120417070 n=1 Tax=Culex pipiens pallens TaxID=42434 RepID=UPI0019546B49|nr:uncharacterized protein LOC120417070 [Culex pipiens pallens]